MGTSAGVRRVRPRFLRNACQTPVPLAPSRCYLQTRPDQTRLFLVKAFNITEAKAQLSAVIQKVEGGEEVIITRAGKPVARVVPYLPTRANRRLGLFENRIQLGEGFDEWPEDIARSLGMLDE